MKKIIYRVLPFLLAALVLIQFFPIEKNQGNYEGLEAFIAETNPPISVVEVLKTSCADCHTNTTNYPWYAQVAPLSFWIQHHVDDGKKHLNFADWSKYSLKRKAHKMEEIAEEVEKDEMPLESYTLIHRDAVLNNDQAEALVAWAQQQKLIYDLKKTIETITD